MRRLILSNLGHTWILDLDGTVLKHNGYKFDGKDSLLDGAKNFFASIPDNDMIIFVTSREKKYAQITEKFLKENDIRYDHIIYEAPFGERILVNDDKPSGLSMAHVINKKRDDAFEVVLEIDSNL